MTLFWGFSVSLKYIRVRKIRTQALEFSHAKGDVHLATAEVSILP